ncbi:MAG: tRNA (pseudouridine(54)-N(1))-methyltransferase TrmY [Candidatus Pacearchaeota archaeon]|jgi:tRNA (pseudouridine54-N1)-methyltransferase
MKHFVYFSSSAVTSGSALSKAEGNLMQAGRMDIAIHSFIQGIFLSHDVRKDVVFHFIFYGMPDPPKHIEILVNSELDISKKDVGNLIKKVLYKYKSGQKTEVFPGCFVEKKSFLNVIEELIDKGNEIFILDKQGQDLREAKISKNCVFVLGDHEGLPKKESKRLKKYLKTISVGPKMYFASQTIAVVNNELDRRNI